MSLEDPAILFGVLTIILGIFSLINSVIIDAVQRRIARRERAAELYTDFYSADNYRRVVLPVVRLMLKWRALPSPLRESYRDCVRMGWLGLQSNPTGLLNAYISESALHEDCAKAHFRDTLSTEAFTEHESLTVFLYFWVKVYEMIRARIVDERKVKGLLGGPYGYYAAFLRELRADIEAHASGDVLPVWVEATRDLDQRFADQVRVAPAKPARA